MSKQSVKVSIFGKNYTLSTDQGHDEMVQASQMVDSLMNEVAQKAPAIQESKAAVLAGLNLASDLVKLQRSYEQAEKKLERLNIVLEEHVSGESQLD